MQKEILIFGFFLYGRWEDLDRWKWVVIDVGVILDTSATHSENLFRHFRATRKRGISPEGGLGTKGILRNQPSQ